MKLHSMTYLKGMRLQNAPNELKSSFPLRMERREVDASAWGLPQR